VTLHGLGSVLSENTHKRTLSLFLSPLFLLPSQGQILYVGDTPSYTFSLPFSAVSEALISYWKKEDALFTGLVAGLITQEASGRREVANPWLPREERAP